MNDLDYTSYINFKENSADVEKYLYDNFYTERMKDFLKKAELENDEELKKELEKKIQKSYFKYFYLIDKFKSKDFVEDTFIASERKAYKEKKVYGKGKLKKAITYLSICSIDGKEIRPKYIKGFKDFFSVYLVNKKEYEESVINGESKLTDLMTKENLRYVGQTIKTRKLAKEIVYHIYADDLEEELIGKEFNFCKTLREEIDSSEEEKYVVFDIISRFDCIKISKEYAYYINRETPNFEISDKEIFRSHIYNHVGLDMLAMNIVYYLMTLNMKKDKEITLIE